MTHPVMLLGMELVSQADLHHHTKIIASMKMKKEKDRVSRTVLKMGLLKVGLSGSKMAKLSEIVWATSLGQVKVES